MGDTDQGSKYLEDAFQVAEKAHDIGLMVPIGYQLCVTYQNWWDALKEGEVARKVIALLESTHTESESFGFPIFNLYSAIASGYGFALAILGNFEEGRVQCEKALQFSTKIADVSSLGWVEWMYGLFFQVQGCGKEVVKHMLKSIKYVEEKNLVVLQGLVLNTLGCGYTLLSQTGIALEHMKKGLESQLDSGIFPGLFQHYAFLGWAYSESGDLENARSHIEKSIELAQKEHAEYVEGYSLEYLGRIIGKADKARFAEAEDSMVRGMKLLDEVKAKPFYAQGCLFLGDLYADMNQKEKAIENLNKAKGMFRDMGMDYWLARTQSVLEKLQG